MANEITNTEASAIIPEVWRAEILNARYSAAVGDKVVYTEFPEVKSRGDIVHLAVFPRLSVNAVGSTGTVTNQALTLTDNSITIAKWFEATVQIVDKAGYQSLLGDPRVFAQRFASQFGPRLAEKMDNDLFAQQSNITTNTVGSSSSPGAMSSALLRQGLQKLDESRVPKVDRGLVLAPEAYWNLFSEDKFALAYATGNPRGASMEGPESVPQLFGVRYFESREITSTGTPASWRNLLLHRESLALVMQRNISVVPLAKVDLSTRITGHVLYDVATIREDHGCVIYSADT